MKKLRRGSQLADEQGDGDAGTPNAEADVARFATRTTLASRAQPQRVVSAAINPKTSQRRS